MIKILLFIGLIILFDACNSSTKLIDPMSRERKSVYIEPDDITELAEGMVDNIIQSSILSKVTTYSFGEIENRSCEDEFDTTLISNRIMELLKNKIGKKISPNSNNIFKGKLFQQCPFEDGKIVVTTTLTLELINGEATWSHSITMDGKSQKSTWVWY